MNCGLFIQWTNPQQHGGIIAETHNMDESQKHAV